MIVLMLLHRLTMAGAELQIRFGALHVRGSGPPLDASLLAELRAHKYELHRLVDGSTCRWCRQPVSLRDQPDTLSLADGTSLHWACRAAFETERRTRAVEARVTYAIGAPGELVDQSS